MAEVSAAAVKALREKTGAGMMDCKKALNEAEGNEDRAIEVLRERGLASAKKKEGRVASEGVVGSYIHMGGKVGVLVEVNCETDFVARAKSFSNSSRTSRCTSRRPSRATFPRDEVSADVLDKEREIARRQAKNDPKNANKPEQVIDKIVEGRLNKFYEEFVAARSAVHQRAGADRRRNGDRESGQDRREDYDSPLRSLQDGRRSEQTRRRLSG
jgi:elongation factor Ts